MVRSLLRAAVAAALVLLIYSPSAFAHAAFVAGAPGPDDEVTGSTGELVISFSQDLDSSRTSLEVRDATGASVARGGALGVGPREFRLALPELAPGAYEVRWTSFSAEDGELARDSYTFTVVATPSPSLSPSPSVIPPSSPSPSPTRFPPTPIPSPSVVDPTDGAAPGGDGVVILPILGASLVVGSIAVWLLRRRAT